MKKICLFIFVYFLEMAVFAQKNYFQFDVLGLEDGLSQSSVKCMLQDRQGFIWIGTQDGLNRYNGYEFEVFRNETENPNSIAGDIIYAIFESKNGQIWIGTNNGLCRFDPIKKNFVSYNETTSLGKMPVYAIREDQKGFLWVGTNDRLCKIDMDNNKIDVFKPNNEKISVNAIFQDSNGKLWLGLEKGLAQFDEEQNQFIVIIPNVHILQITQDKGDTLWVGSNTGLHFLDIKNLQSQENLPLNMPVQTVFIDESNNVWIGTYTGLFQFDRRQNTLRYISKKNTILSTLSNDHINCIFEDRIGSLWVGTNAGINKLSTLSKTFTHYRYVPMTGSTLSSDMVTSFLETKNRGLWVGTDGGGLNKLDTITGEFLHFVKQSNKNSLSNNSVWCLTEDQENKIWIGTSKGLNIFDAEKQEFKTFFHNPQDSTSLPNDFVVALLEDHKGTIWVGTHGGGLGMLAFEQKASGKFRNFGNKTHSSIRCLYQDRKGTIWVGTQGGGLLRFSEKNQNFEVFKNNPNNKKSISSNYIWSIAEDSKGTLWVGTSEGLNRMEDNKSFQVFTKKDGLPNNVIYGIINYENQLWISTNRGLSRLDLSKMVFRNFDVKDGLQGNEFNGGAYYKNQENELFFGGSNGYNTFQPKRIIDNPFQPSVVITSCKVFNKELDLDSAITYKKYLQLPLESNFISFEFAALNYIFSEKNQYEYKLEGFDEHWIEAGNRRYATYTNLPAGDYVFRVRASNNDGVWNKEGTKIKLTITTPFWNRLWFKTLATLILVFSLYYVLTHFNRQKLIKILSKSSWEKSLFLVCVFDQNGFILETNSQFEAIFGKKTRFDELFSQLTNKQFAFEGHIFELLCQQKGDVFELVLAQRI